MRHSKIDLTMSVYTDPRLLDVTGALDSLLSLSLGTGEAEGEAMKATGTDAPQHFGVQASANSLAPLLAPAFDNRLILPSTCNKAFTDEPKFKANEPIAVSLRAFSRRDIAQGLDSGQRLTRSGPCYARDLLKGADWTTTRIHLRAELK